MALVFEARINYKYLKLLVSTIEGELADGIRITNKNA